MAHPEMLSLAHHPAGVPHAPPPLTSNRKLLLSTEFHTPPTIAKTDGPINPETLARARARLQPLARPQAPPPPPPIIKGRKKEAYTPSGTVLKPSVLQKSPQGVTPQSLQQAKKQLKSTKKGRPSRCRKGREENQTTPSSQGSGQDAAEEARSKKSKSGKVNSKLKKAKDVAITGAPLAACGSLAAAGYGAHLAKGSMDIAKASAEKQDAVNAKVNAMGGNGNTATGPNAHFLGSFAKLHEPNYAGIKPVGPPETNAASSASDPA
ncbi:hypothetical protein MMC13_005782 [Lambiella insularis]|nr:hypothetical protein [Lambiella insularis]